MQYEHSEIPNILIIYTKGAQKYQKSNNNFAPFYEALLNWNSQLLKHVT
jgi:hypothetical protein